MGIASATPSPVSGHRHLRRRRVRGGDRACRYVVCYSERRGLVERRTLSALGLLVAAGGRLGQGLRAEQSNGRSGAQEPTMTSTSFNRMPVAPAEPPGRTRGWREAAVWLYLCGTLAPTFTVIPAGWVHGPVPWRLAAGSAFPALILVLVVAYAWAAPAWTGCCRAVTGGSERAVLRAGHDAVCEIRARRRELGRLAEVVPPEVLDRALWDLAGLLVSAEQARIAKAEVRSALSRIPPGEPPATELRARQAELAGTRRDLWTQSRRRLASLRRLAATCRDLVAERAAAPAGVPDRLDPSAVEVDRPGAGRDGGDPGSGPGHGGGAAGNAGTDPDPLAVPAERLAGALDAYRRLRAPAAPPGQPA